MGNRKLPLSMRRNFGLGHHLTCHPVSLPLTNSFINSSMSTLDPTRSPQQLTISSGPQISFYDSIELQVRAIIWLARQEMDERLNSPRSVQSFSLLSLRSPLHSPPGISMKRSLQRFLQKRRNRIQASYPCKG